MVMTPGIIKKVDCRLGTNEDFEEVCKDLHAHNVKIVLDGVFNHVGRGFWAFKDVLEKKWDSPYKWQLWWKLPPPTGSFCRPLEYNLTLIVRKSTGTLMPTPTDEELCGAIRFAKQLGLQVALKPTVNCANGVWRARISLF